MKRALKLLPVTAVLLLSACENKNAEPQARSEEAYKPAEEKKYEPTPTYVDTGATMEPMDSPPPAAGGGAGRGEASGDELLTPGGSGGGRTYVVQKGDTLYAIARKFYGDQSKWKVIYNANRGQLKSPDKLTAGMKLVIP